MNNIAFRKSVFVYIISSTLLLVAASFFWDRIPMSESVYFFEASQSLEKAYHNFWHPPVYVILLSLFNLVISAEFSSGYWLGFFSVIVSGGLILKIIGVSNSDIFKQPQSIAILLLCYFSLPVVFHGIFLFDIDNTILTPILLWSYLIYLRFREKQNFTNFLIFVVILSFGLWSKMTTPILLMGTMGLYHLLKRDFRFLAIKLVPVFIVSLVLFWLTYGWLYTSYVLDGYGSFQFSGGKAWGLLSGQYTFQLPLKQLIFSIASNVGATFVWSSLWLIIPFLLVCASALKKNKYRFSLLFIAVLFISYSILLKIQTTAGFPKYHYPFYSFLFVLLGVGIAETKWKFSWKDIIILVCLLFFTISFTSDYIFTFYTFGREHLFKDLVISLGQYLGYTSIPIVALYLLKKNDLSTINDIVKLLIVAIILFNISGLFFRVKAEYSTNYHYGVRKTEQALKYANGISESKTVYFPYAGIFMKGALNSENPSYGRIENHSFFKPETDYIIISDPMIQSGTYFFKMNHLNLNYSRIKTIGSYGVWKRNE